MQTKLTDELTRRQVELLKVIADFKVNRCYSPTIAELGHELNLSRSTVFEHLGELRKKGYLATCTGKARSLKLTSRSHELLDRLVRGASDCCDEQSGGIPMAGTVAAGVPIEAIEESERLSLSEHFGTGDGTFALEVRGDSMIDEDIRSGDHVICRHSSTANEGELVVAIVDDENATLKRFYKEKNRVRLQPANDDYQPIYSENCRIEAVVVGLVRKF